MTIKEFCVDIYRAPIAHQIESEREINIADKYLCSNFIPLSKCILLLNANFICTKMSERELSFIATYRIGIIIQKNI